MEVGRLCVLRIASAKYEAEADCTTVSGVVIGKQAHIEDSSRFLYYFHCTSIELPLAYRTAMRKDFLTTNTPSRGKSGSSELTVKSTYLQSTPEGYKYQFDGWYEGEELTPTADIYSGSIPSQWMEAMRNEFAPCEVRYLCYSFHPWFSTAPESLLYLTLPADRHRCYSLYLCHRCLTPFFSQVHLTVHLEGYCSMRTPPGLLIYHNQRSQLKVYYVDGAKHLHYGRCISLVGKCFIESKILKNDVDLYEFFVVTVPLRVCLEDGSGGDTSYDAEKWNGDVVAGYFSRLKHSAQTLSCIVVLPPFQHMHLGIFLLDVAYQLTKVRQADCGCELCGAHGGIVSRPFSPHGQLLLLSYWSAALKRILRHSSTPSSQSPESLTFESWAELRDAFDIPIHLDDLQFLMVHDKHAFYSAAEGGASTASVVFEEGELEGRSRTADFRFSEECLTRNRNGALTYNVNCFHY